MTPSADDDNARAETVAAGKAVVRAAATGLRALEERIGDAFASTVDAILNCPGSVVTTGIGKAGHIANKVAATFASTGTPAFFLHPTEAIHGDLGRVGPDDVVLMFSNSGSSTELLRLIPPLKGLGATPVAITAQPRSKLARECDLVIDLGDQVEAGPLGLAPTTSTTVMLVMGDALAMAVLGRRDFSPAEFARYHPGGALGRSLLRVGDVMRRGDANPVVSASASVLEALHVMSTTAGRPGATSVVEDSGVLVGFYTDGNFRRTMEAAVAKDDLGFIKEPIRLHMTREPRTIREDQLVSEAMRVLREHKIDQLPVVDADGRPIGLLDVQDILDVKVVP